MTGKRLALGPHGSSNDAAAALAALASMVDDVLFCQSVLAVLVPPRSHMCMGPWVLCGVDATASRVVCTRRQQQLATG